MISYTKGQNSASVIVYVYGKRIGQADLIRGFWELYRAGRKPLVVASTGGGGLERLTASLELAYADAEIPAGWGEDNLFSMEVL